MDENNYEELNKMENEIPSLTPEEPTKSSGGKGPIVLLVAVIIVLVGTAVFGFMNFSISKTQKFVNILTDESLLGVSKEIVELASSDGKFISDISVDPSALAQMADVEVPISRLALVSEQDTNGTDYSGKVYLDIDSTELVTLKYAKTGDMFGLTIPDLMNEYFVVKNENLKELARKFGASEEEIEQIPNKITEEELTKMMGTENIDVEELKSILKKYVRPLSKVIDANLSQEKDQEVSIAGETLVTTKHSLKLTEKMLYESSRDFFEIAKDDEDLYNFYVNSEADLEVYGAEAEIASFEEWNKIFTDAYNESLEYIEKADNETVMLELAAYVDGGTTLAVEMSMPSEDVLFRIATLNEKNTSTTEIVIEVEGGEIKLVFTTDFTKNKYNGTINAYVNIDNVNFNLDIVNYSIEYSKNTNLEKLDATKNFILNDETEESIKEKVVEIEGNITNYVTTITEKAPESLTTFIGSLADNNLTDNDNDYENEAFAIDGEQVYILSESNEIYGKMKLGMTRDEIIALMGVPDYDETFGSMTFIDWEDEYYNEHSVVIENGVVTEVSRNLNSSSYDNIQLSAELKTEVEDLKVDIKNVKEDMTLAEVKAILGDKCFESEKTNAGEFSYTWYDKAENNVEIAFDEDGKAWYIGTVLESY